MSKKVKSFISTLQVISKTSLSRQLLALALTTTITTKKSKESN